jgi:hypothetical protein
MDVAVVPVDAEAFLFAVIIVHRALYPQKLALTSPTSGGRSVDIVRSQSNATEFSLVFSLTLGAWTRQLHVAVDFSLRRCSV